jgi:hypothetical protein
LQGAEIMIASGLRVLLVVVSSAIEPMPPIPNATAPEAMPAGPSPELAPPPVRRWYGWQLAISDVTFLTVGTLSKHGRGALVATGGLALGAPILHFVHGDWKIGIGSTLVRAAAIAAVASAGGTWAWHESPPPCQGSREVCDPTFSQVTDEAGTNLLKAVGLLAVGGLFMLDDTIGSFEGPWPPPSVRAPKPSAAPTVNPTPGGLALGLVGTF